MGYANFPEFKRFNEARTSANNSMLALLAGARLASHTLTMTDGSLRLLPEIYPAVRDIDRFNLVTERARALLDDADSELAKVTVPYAMSTHEDFVFTVIEMVRLRGTRVTPPPGKSLGPVNMHERLFAGLGLTKPGAALELFHILREMRNSHIHEGGRANARLTAMLASVSPGAESVWARIALQPTSSIVVAGQVEFVLGHIFVVFAVIKQLARDIDVALMSHWSAAQWSEIVVNDYQATTTKIRNSSSWRRSLVGHARLEYGPLGLTQSDLEAAARRLDAWTAGPWI